MTHLSRERIAEIQQYLACRPPYGTIRFADESMEAMLAERAADVALLKSALRLCNPHSQSEFKRLQVQLGAAIESALREKGEL